MSLSNIDCNDLNTINFFYVNLLFESSVFLTKTTNKFFKPAQKEEIPHSKFKERFWKFQRQIFEKAAVSLYINNDCLGEQLPLFTRKKLGWNLLRTKNIIKSTKLKYQSLLLLRIIFGDCVSIVPTNQVFLTRTTHTTQRFRPNIEYGDYI